MQLILIFSRSFVVPLQDCWVSMEILRFLYPFLQIVKEGEYEDVDVK